MRFNKIDIYVLRSQLATIYRDSEYYMRAAIIISFALYRFMIARAPCLWAFIVIYDRAGLMRLDAALGMCQCVPHTLHQSNCCVISGCIYTYIRFFFFQNNIFYNVHIFFLFSLLLYAEECKNIRSAIHKSVKSGAVYSSSSSSVLSSGIWNAKQKERERETEYK